MDYEEFEKSDNSLDTLLEEVRSFAPSSDGDKPAKSEEKTHKNWSLDDIDRLIADTIGENPAARAFAPVKKEPAVQVDEAVFTPSAAAEEPAPAAEPEKAAEPEQIVLEPINIEPVNVEPVNDAPAAREPVTEETAPVITEETEPVKEPAAQEKKEPADDGRIYFKKTARVLKEEAIANIAARTGKIETFPENEKTIAFTKLGSQKREEERKPVYLPDTDPEIPLYDSFGEQHIPDFDPLAVYEERIKAELGRSMETDENRRSFISPMQLDPVEEQPEEPGPVEKPGILLEKSHAQMTSGLEPLPKVISADKALHSEVVTEKTIVPGTPSVASPFADEGENEEFPGQIMIDGFDENVGEAEPETVDEFDVEVELLEKRKLRAKEFKIIPGTEEEEEDEKPEEPEQRKKKKLFSSFGKPKSNENARFGVRLTEYNEPADRRAAHSSLNNAASGFSKQIVLCSIIEAALLLFAVLPNILSAAGINSALFGAGGNGGYVVSAILLIVAIAANSSVFSSGMAKIFSREMDSESAVALSAAVAFIHNTVTAVVNGDSAGKIPVFSMAAVFGFIIINASGLINCRRVLRSFELCAYKYERGPFVVRGFEDEKEQREMSRGMLMDKAEMYYSAKTLFPSDFIRNSANTSAERRAAGIIIPVAAAAAIITGAVALVISENHSAIDAFTVCAGTFCACSPVFAAFVPAVLVKAANRTLNAEGSLVTGFDSAEELGTANGVVIDSADIFDRSKCKMHGMLDFKKIRIDDVLVYAAALVIKSGGPLRDCFENVISSDHGLLPQVRELVYEDKLGISARIVGQKVLLGNRALLQNHGVEVPDRSIETKHTSSGRRVIYLAVCGQLAAMFVVSYAVDESLREYLERLEAAGTKIIVRTNDVNVTEEMLARGFEMPKSAFCVLGSVAGRIYTNRRDEVTERCPVHLVHNGTALTMMRAFAAIQQLCRDMDVLFVIQVILCVLGFVGAAALTGLSMLEQLNGITVSAFLALSAGITALAANLLNGKD